MLETLDLLLAEVVDARDAAGLPKGEAGEVQDRQSFDEFKRAAQHLELARTHLVLNAERKTPTNPH